jgi:rhodanese-related sulfurtransferase
VAQPPRGDAASAALALGSRAALAVSRVLVVGADQTSVASVQYLAMVGLGTLGIVDDQAVNNADIASSRLFAPDSAGMPRARAMAEWVRSVPGATVVRVHPFAPGADAWRLLDGYDAVVDASGSPDVSRSLAEEAGGRRIPVVASDDALFSAAAPTISAEALESRLALRSRGLDNFTLLDVRERPEHDVDSIGGSVPASGFGSTSAVWPVLERGRPVVVVCDRGARSQAAARLLRADGHDVEVLERGMRGWNLRPSALTAATQGATGAGAEAATGRVPLPLADIDPDGFRPNLHS